MKMRWLLCGFSRRYIDFCQRRVARNKNKCRLQSIQPSQYNSKPLDSESPSDCVRLRVKQVSGRLIGLQAHNSKNGTAAHKAGTRRCSRSLSNDALRFILLQHNATSLEESVAEVQPEYTHQTFGQAETIRGYRGLDLRVFLDCLTFHALVQIRCVQLPVCSSEGQARKALRAQAFSHSLMIDSQQHHEALPAVEVPVTELLLPSEAAE